MNDTAIIISIIAGSLTITGTVFGFAWKLISKLNKQLRAFEETQALAKQNDAASRLLLKASLATLDGLKQQGCNGAVSKMHAMLLEYAVDK